MSKLLQPTEHQEQVFIFNYMKLKHADKIIFAIPNQRKTSIQGGRYMKAEGVVAGIPDIMLAYPSNEYSGLFIELKRRKGAKPTELQLSMIERLNNAGYKAIVCYGADEAVEEIEKYINHC